MKFVDICRMHKWKVAKMQNPILPIFDNSKSDGSKRNTNELSLKKTAQTDRLNLRGNNKRIRKLGFERRVKFHFDNADEKQTTNDLYGFNEGKLLCASNGVTFSDPFSLVGQTDDSDIECKMISKQDNEGDCILFVAIICKKRELTVALLNILRSSVYLRVTNKLFQNALHLAAIIGDHVMVRRLLVGGIQVDKKDRRGNTALHIACNKGLLAIAEAVLTPVKYIETTVNRYKAPFIRIPQNLEIRNNEGLTCLHIAARRKDIEMMELLLDKNADINAKQMKDGKTILHHFCEVGDIKCIEFLLKYKELNLNATTYSGTSATDIAKCRGHIEIVKLLLHAGAYQIQYQESQCEMSDSDSLSE